MQPSTYLARCILALGLGSLALASPVIPKAVDISEDVERSIPDAIARGVKPVDKETNSHNINRDANPGEAGLFDFLFPSLIPTSSASPTATATSIPTSTVTLLQAPSNTDAAAALNYHNYARQDRGLRPLLWDTSLEAQALTYAKKIASYGRVDSSTTSTRLNQGENLVIVQPTFIFFYPVSNPLQAATDKWLAEIKNYNNETIPLGNFKGYKDYTQIVWNTTTTVGIAAAKNWLGAWYVVARYSPAGNINGQKPY